MKNNENLNIATVAKQLKDGQIIPFGIKKDADGMENFVLLIRNSHKKIKKALKSLETLKMYRVILPIKKEDKYIYISLLLISFSEEQKYLTFVASGLENDYGELYKKSLLTSRVTIVLYDGNIMHPILVAGPTYDKEIKYSNGITNKDIQKIGTLLNAIGPEKFEEKIDAIYLGEEAPFGEELSLDIFSVSN